MKVKQCFVIACVSLFINCCSPAFLSTAITSGAKTAKSASIRNEGRLLEQDSVQIDHNIDYASYYIYRNGSFVGSVLSCLVYDNENYITVANVKTFEKVNYVLPGSHTFTSKVGSKDSVQVYFEPGETYIVQVLANSKITKDVLFIMDSVMIEKEISKGKFLSKEFAKKELSISDFNY